MKVTNAPHILLLDLYVGGHHGQYIRHIIDYWGKNALSGRLDIAVPTYFGEHHPDVPKAIARYPGADIRHLSIDLPEPLPFPGPLGLVRTDHIQGRLLRELVERHRPDHCVLMYIDHMLLSLGFNLRFKLPVTLSGIYFRPAFHYQGFEGDVATLKERLKRLEKRFRLKRALRNPHLSHLLCLDPYVVPHVARMTGGTKAVALPDGITLHESSFNSLSRTTSWEIAPGRKVALLFGVIDERKGVFQVIEALRRLPPDTQQQVALILAGPVPQSEYARLEEALAALRMTSAVQIVQDNRFIPDEEIQDLIHQADLVLVTYQRHVGSSNVLVRAAAANRPVLGSSYGLVGEHIRCHRLGLAVDTTDPLTLANGFQRWLTAPATFPFDTKEAVRFAAAHTAEAFAATILNLAR